MLSQRALSAPHGSSVEYECRKLLCRIAASPSDVLEFSYFHKIITGLVKADIKSIIDGRTYEHELNRGDCEGMTPLHWAAFQENVPALRALLQARADVEARDNSERTALHWGARSGNQRCVELLLIAGSDVHAKDRFGYQALHYAMLFTDNKELLDTLLIAGANIHDRTTEGCPPLQGACVYNRTNNITALLTAGAHIDSQDNDGDTPLLDSIHNGRAQAVELLLHHGANISYESGNGRTVLHHLALWGNLETITPFMSCQSCQLENLDVEKRDKRGRSASEELQDRLAPPEGFRNAFGNLLARCKAQRGISLAEPLAGHGYCSDSAELSVRL